MKERKKHKAQGTTAQTYDVGRIYDTHTKEDWICMERTAWQTEESDVDEGRGREAVRMGLEYVTSHT